MVQELQQIVDQSLHWLANNAAAPTATYVLARVASPLILGSTGNVDEKKRDNLIAASAAAGIVGLQAYGIVTPNVPSNLEYAAGIVGSAGAGAAGGGLARAARATFNNKPADAIREAFYKGASKGAIALPIGIVALDYLARRL